MQQWQKPWQKAIVITKLHNYLKDLKYIKNKNPEQLTSTNNVLKIVLTLIYVQTYTSFFRRFPHTIEVLNDLINNKLPRALGGD
jgi:hypothetical protein